MTVSSATGLTRSCNPNGSVCPPLPGVPASGRTAATVPPVPGRSPLRRRRHSGRPGGHGSDGRPSQPTGLGGSYSQATNQVHAWLGRRGPPRAPTPRTAYQVRGGPTSRQVTAEARAAVAAAQRWRASLGGAALSRRRRQRPPRGERTIADRRPGALCSNRPSPPLELAVGLVDQAASEAHQRWGKALRRADWAAALRQAETVKGDQADTATAWLRAKVNPPPRAARRPARLARSPLPRIPASV